MTKNKQKNYGFVRDEITEDRYVFGVFGSIPKDVEIVLQEDANWVDDALVTPEAQDKYVETSNCTGFNTTTPIEMIIKKKYNIEENFSDRFLGIVAGTKPPGNSPHTVAEAIRHNGLVSEEVLPFDSLIDSIDKYYSPDPLPSNISQKALLFLEKYDFYHDYVFRDHIPLEQKHLKLKQALKYCPVGISVCAWEKDENGFFVKSGPDNHWTTLVGFKEKEYWVVFDSYPEDGNFIKKIKWETDFEVAKRYFIKKKLNNNLPKQNWFSKLIREIKIFIKNQNEK